MADEPQVVRGGGAHLVGVLHSLLPELHGEAHDLVSERGERLDELRHALGALRFLDEAFHESPELRKLDPAVEQHLSAEEVERLDVVGALVDHVDAGVAHVLIHAPLLDVAVATEDLQGEVRG